MCLWRPSTLMYIHTNVPVYDRPTLMLVRFLRPRQPQPRLAGLGTGMERKRDKEGSLRENLHPLPRYRSISTRLVPSHYVETIEAQAKALLEHIHVSRPKGQGGEKKTKKKKKTERKKGKKERKKNFERSSSSHGPKWGIFGANIWRG